MIITTTIKKKGKSRRIELLCDEWKKTRKIWFIRMHMQCTCVFCLFNQLFTRIRNKLMCYSNLQQTSFLLLVLPFKSRWKELTLKRRPIITYLLQIIICNIPYTILIHNTLYIHKNFCSSVIIQITLTWKYTWNAQIEWKRKNSDLIVFLSN